jgi:pimeloyl-ACP methyl ester carboxylesterase
MRSVEGQNTLASSTARPTTATLQAPTEPLGLATETTSPAPAMPPTAVIPLTPAVVDQRVDIGVATLHIRCLGQGGPTVILESGPRADWSVWETVMSGVAQFTRVCAYDRAGLGESTRGPKPRTSQQMADELAALLDRGNIPGPYVLVSHSTSNWIDRLYTAQHRDRVAALVFVSPWHEDLISGTLAILEPYPSDLETFRYQTTLLEESGVFQNWLTSAAQVRDAGSLANLPLVLLAPSPLNSTEPYGPQMDAMLAQQQQQLLALSANSARLVAESSGHFIYRDQPQAVVEAIQLVFEKITPRK